MSSRKPIQIVDLFAGPGGLGEGFSSYNEGRDFTIKVSAEMDPAARATLRLRAFYRALKFQFPDALHEYYTFCETGDLTSLSKIGAHAWAQADEEAQLIELGSVAGNNKLDAILDKRLDTSQPWVLIGGPPCQAYSIVGRARNRGKSGYSAADDHRHFLYREYLRIIQSKKPAIFVMENVKGILSSKIDGKNIFPDILRDLSDPNAALGNSSDKGRYRIFSLVSDDIYESGNDPESVISANFIIKAEQFGIPQARHRVILLGISEDLLVKEVHRLNPEPGLSVQEVIGSLPPLRSTITRGPDSYEKWSDTVLAHVMDLQQEASRSCQRSPKSIALAAEFGLLVKSFGTDDLSPGGLRVPKSQKWDGQTGSKLDKWYVDDRLRYWLNHEARGHMSSDLRRYVFAAAYGSAYKRSPKGHEDFNLSGLEPAHKNWKSGKFSDRFRVQLRGQPATTITSHIAKDGHYFIHYDPRQCRSLTVREAARLQTFPDNYFFLGNRSQQFHQVGNAVPPLLAYQIAELVSNILAGEKSRPPELENQLVAI
ncbi:DNA cytosine methyltransferase [Halopseudomonas sp.]|uniref:DNA cytosine methyltransferase n=1 Tax=Halopseudomonas sp. TaxID=2901191 RepID=UPI0030030A6F